GLDAEATWAVTPAGGAVTLRTPAAYQKAGLTKQAVTGNFALLPGDRVGFEVGSYDPALPLYIDPVLSYSGYLGGSGADSGWGIAVDGARNAYVTGTTASGDFPGAGNSFAGSTDVFVAKFSASGGLVYPSYLAVAGAAAAL